MEFKNILKELTDLELVSIYGVWLDEMKLRGMIRTNNVVGELGEWLAIKYYSVIPGLPKLQAAPTGTKNVDALSVHGERYSIKSTTGTTTGAFHGLNDRDSVEKERQKFEYVIIVQFNKDFTLKAIYEIEWEVFLKHKRWHSTMRAWNLSVSKALINDSRCIYPIEETKE
ncbi:hypothetical protein M4D56_01985 [Cytobacillus oceanisediminis]|uniref:DUF6998 domain-containing protein n=1 Tax=Cytobacillus oceanisediminis TaxID=665099 RepID=UPI00203C918D|nr:hypothetical protein [Cytobacillus oceanisediminis]MCM3527865.1 hypothetical protein [Cytobacillus oceanisediminis]